MFNSTPALLLFIFVSVSVSGLAAGDSAADSRCLCINKANENNLALQKSFNQSWEPLSMSYLAFNNVSGRDSGRASVSYPKSGFACQSDLAYEQKIELNHVVNTLNNPTISTFKKIPQIVSAGNLGFPPATQTHPQYKSEMIRKDCIVAAMKRNPGNQGYVCGYAGDQNPIGSNTAKNTAKQSVLKLYGKASGPTAQCVDSKMTDYIHYAVNTAIQCLSGVGKIDSKTLFRKINNESAFNISVASDGGLGIAQMTTNAVEEMTDSKLGKGRYVLEHVASSRDPSCTGFKDVAIQDLKNSPSTRESNRCAWLSPGDGLARNLMYSIGYYLTMRDKYLVPALKQLAPDLANNEALVNDLTSVSYGAEGIKHAKNLLRRFRVTNGTNVAELRKNIRGGSVYLKAIESTMREVSCIRNKIDPNGNECKRTKFEPGDLEGDSCVSSI